VSVTGVQLDGRPPLTKSQTGCKSAFVTVAQLASPLAVWVKAAAWSVMQAEYCITVTVQSFGMSLQLGLLGLACRQVDSWSVQLFCNTESEVALLDMP
jgi:hypothetical protein